MAALSVSFVFSLSNTETELFKTVARKTRRRTTILKSVCRAILVFLADILCVIGIDEKTLYSS